LYVLIWNPPVPSDEGRAAKEASEVMDIGSIGLLTGAVFFCADFLGTEDFCLLAVA